jgi:hypothetical protein
MRRLALSAFVAAVVLAAIPGDAAAGPPEGDFAYAPPPWFEEGRALLISRGGECESSTQTSEPGGY